MSKTSKGYITEPDEATTYLKQMCKNAERHGIQIMFVVSKIAMPNMIIGMHTPHGECMKAQLTKAIAEEFEQQRLFLYLDEIDKYNGDWVE